MKKKSSKKKKGKKKAKSKDIKYEAGFKKMNYNRSDPIHKRSTYGVVYPQTDLVFDKFDKSDKFESKTELFNKNELKRFVRGKRMQFNLKNSTLRKILFTRSAFHYLHGDSKALIDSLSFEDCDFNYCFMGGSIYSRVVFRRCTFSRCDFMNSEFKGCIFENCIFTKCSAYRTIFDDTEVNPELFYNSIEVPVYNFTSLSEEKRKEIERDWLDVQVALSRQLLKSSKDISHTDYIDQSMVLLKISENLKLKDKLFHVEEYLIDRYNRKPTSLKKFIARITTILLFSLQKINLILTKGGTSFPRLLFTGLILLLIISIHLYNSQILYGTNEILLSDLGNGEWYSFLSIIPFSISLLLGFGYSGFTAPFNQIWIIALYASLGIAWYALLVQLIVRKIYR